MTKFAKILEEQNKTVFDVGKAMGLMQSPRSLRNLQSGKTLISDCDFVTIDFLKRYLGVETEDLMESFELDGTNTNINYLKNFKKRLLKKFIPLDEDSAYLLFKVRQNPCIGFISEDDNGNNEIVFVLIDPDGTFESLKATYTIQDGYREANFSKTVSVHPLFKETPLFFEPSLFLETQNKKGIGKNKSDSPTHEPSINLEELLKLVDTEEQETLDYFDFMKELEPVVYAFTHYK